jgi:transposase
MYIDEVPNRNSPPAILLRESFRQNGKIRKRTLANISHWPKDKIDALRAVLRNQLRLPPRALDNDAAASSAPPSDAKTQSPFRILRPLPHGHVKAVLGTLQKLGIDTMIAVRRSRERDLVVGMIVARLLFPRSKLDTTVRWKDCSLAQILSVEDADENQLYAALDWLLKRKSKIEKKLAQKHLSDGSSVLYDLSTSYYTGTQCPLAQYGGRRGGEKKRFPIILYGVLANREGCPVGVEVYKGNTGEPTTIPDVANKLRNRFDLERAVVVGDRGNVTNTTIEKLQEHPALGWIGALKSDAIRILIEKGKLETSLFDRQNLAEISSDAYPGERLIACFNPLMAEQRREKRRELLEATQKLLDKLVAQVRRRRKKPLSAPEIGLKAGKIVNRYKMAKHFDLSIDEGSFAWKRNQQGIEKEEQLDGIYVIRTSESKQAISAPDVVRTYKSLSQVEQAFRCLKTVDLRIRPIYLRDPDHVKAHIFICVLAYYIEWHLRRSWAPLLYADEELDQARQTRDPVAPAEPSPSAKRKKVTHHTDDGLQVQPFSTLLEHLSRLTVNTCCIADDPNGSTFQQEAEPTPLQTHAFELLNL